ncbi:hypothetical protein F4780DRAFT_754329 [Xylariomycetidae sp. FL0641]|nr:hypothetical protein F4780DRAFT_754329 [Xylariomycetidae sp. FL0641]
MLPACLPTCLPTDCLTAASEYNNPPHLLQRNWNPPHTHTRTMLRPSLLCVSPAVDNSSQPRLPLPMRIPVSFATKPIWTLLVGTRQPGPFRHHQQTTTGNGARRRPSPRQTDAHITYISHSTMPSIRYVIKRRRVLLRSRQGLEEKKLKLQSRSRTWGGAYMGCVGAYLAAAAAACCCRCRYRLPILCRRWPKSVSQSSVGQLNPSLCARCDRPATQRLPIQTKPVSTHRLRTVALFSSPPPHTDLASLCRSM